MPPKRRSSAALNQVTVVSNVSTRSRTSHITARKKALSKTASNRMPKATAKRGKAPPKSTKAKKSVNRKGNSEVMSQKPQLDDSKLESLLSQLEDGGDEVTSGEAQPLEQVFFKVDDRGMESSVIENLESETCEITNQLENLNVVVDEQPEELSSVHAVLIDNDNSQELEEQVIELDGDAYDVEYVAEEFVPIAENTEIIMDEEVESNDKSEVVTSNDEEQKEDENADAIKDLSEILTDIKVEDKEPSTVEAGEATEVKEQKPKAKKKPVKKVAKKVTSKKKPTKPKQTKKEPTPNKIEPKQTKPSSTLEKTEEVRRSSRIKSINVLKQRSKVVKSDAESPEPTLATTSTTEKVLDQPTPVQEDTKPVKVKSRWRRSSELEMNVLTPASVVMETCGDGEKIAEVNDILANKGKVPNPARDDEVETRLKQFIHLKENQYLTDRMTCKEAKKMTCDCFLMPEDIEKGEGGCGEDCLNRLLMIECGSLCPVSERCTNKKFQKSQFAPIEVFKTEKKGLGLRAAANIPYGEFIIEYVGEVLDPEEFDKRADDYSNDKNTHYYFMALRADAIIDATRKGNISRFINHSCDPNAETQKWTVNGELRIGFFSTRTILAGEEITFDYRFERYGKEAQKCYCETSACRGWLGEEPDDEDEEEEEGSEEEEETEVKESIKEEVQEASSEVTAKVEVGEEGVKVEEVVTPVKKEKKKRSPKKKPRKELLEELDQLDEEIELLVTTGLKNQAHTLKLSRLMVRAKEHTQRAKLLRVLRRGELPCRRLFLDYHGLRLIHGYMTDAQQWAKSDNKYESLRLELLQTLATLPIPNKTMLQDSKVLPTVELWSSTKGEDLPLDSDSSSPQTDQEVNCTPTHDEKKENILEDNKNQVKFEEDTEIRRSVGMDYKGKNETGPFVSTHGKELADEISGIFQEDSEMSSPSSDTKPKNIVTEAKSDEINYEEEITALAQKLLEEWSSLKEVFKIPKKERIEQMKEHEREANRGYIAGLGLEQDAEKKSENRYRILKRYRSLDKMENSVSSRKSIKLEDRNNSSFPMLGKMERRKMFALQVEQREEERRRKQREMWRQHEQHCILLGTDPRLTAPFDPNRGYQCIWNPQIGQWQNYPIQNTNVIFNPQTTVAAMNMQQTTPNFPFLQTNMHAPNIITSTLNPMHPLPSLPYQEEAKKEEDCSQVKFMGPIPPPAKLPPKWKCAKDKYGRPYYYHVKIRKSQWEPPPLPAPQDEPDDTSSTTSSSDTSSLSSDTSSEETESDDDLDDSKLIMEVRKQMEKPVKLLFSKSPTPQSQVEKSDDSPLLEAEEESKPQTEQVDDEDSKDNVSSVDLRLKEILKDEKLPTPSKKRRAGLVSEIIISPRTEEDRLQFKEDLKRYKLNKEKLRKEKDMVVHQKKHPKEKRPKASIKLKMKEMADANSESAKKIKESFRSIMATVVVNVLNAYRKPDCKEGRITNTEDFKHLARKLTHFVMLKEMKHIEKIEDLVCTENVKSKAKEYIRKYMSKFGENYQKRNDEPDF